MDPETEITRPRCYPRPVRFLLAFKLSQALDLLGPMEGLSALVVCAGSGMDSEYLCRRGMRVIATDISMDALLRARERARRYGVAYALAVADAERLPLRDGAVDVAFVHDGLHHLPDPARAVREMVRVCSKAVVIAEPARSPITQLAVRLGFSGEYEEAGNRVYRFSAHELCRLLRDAGMWSCVARHHVIYYQPWTFRIYRRLESEPLFWAFRTGFGLLNRLIGRWGNSLKVVAWKTPSPGSGSSRGSVCRCSSLG